MRYKRSRNESSGPTFANKSSTELTHLSRYSTRPKAGADSENSALLASLTVHTSETHDVQITEARDSSGRYTLTVMDGAEPGDAEDDYGLRGYGRISA